MSPSAFHLKLPTDFGQARALRAAIARHTWLPAILAILLAGPAWACGPFFPSTIIWTPDGAALVSPVADCRLELSRIKPARLSDLKLAPAAATKAWSLREYVDLSELRANQTAAADQADLDAALKDANVPAEKRQTVLEKYAAARQEVTPYLKQVDDWRERCRWLAPGEKPPPRPIMGNVAVPDGLPGEFADYFRGAVAYHKGDFDAARAAWKALLDRPEADRKRRSVWAAYMIARSWTDSDPKQAVAWFDRTRKLAQSGLADSTGLAVASLGWQGRIEFRARRYEQAVELYLQQQSAGDANAWLSLRWLVQKVFDDDAQALGRLARDRASREVITAVVVASMGPSTVEFRTKDLTESKCGELWLAALEKSGAKVENTDRVAMLAYQASHYASAARWLDRGDDQTPVALWVRAKLQLRDGHVDQAATLLAKAAKTFPPNEEWNDAKDAAYDQEGDMSDGGPPHYPRGQVEGELACIRLARGQYVEALDLLLRNDWWADAAYVAERVLTADELLQYVRKHWPAQAGKKSPPDPTLPPVENVQPEEMTPAGRAAAIRHLLARRLTRIGRWKEAREFYPPELLDPFDKYIGGIRDGANAKLPKPQRAEALWIAARIARKSGLELLGTEGAPDYFIHGGQFSDAPGEDTDEPARAPKEKLLKASKDELDRYRQSVPEILKRYHYRYVAAGHAWDAAVMMPDQSNHTAEVLCQAGRWLAQRDPKAADRFYKALVLRCGKTSLGQTSQAVHWFPPEPKTPASRSDAQN
jgi:tetratricopeptide (TPR) repeat protein